MTFKYALGLAALPFLVYACNSTDSSTETESSSETVTLPGGQRSLYNAEAVIPPMCYTRTEGQHNPCYTCHQNAINGVGHENRMDDGFLQGDYTFSDTAQFNHYTNLFVDRSEQVNAISDAEILSYINEDNYSDLASRLEQGGFDGWIPDLANLQNPGQAFDADGFAKDGSGWVAFNYKPLPSTFWPTNGSTDDVIIRLPEKFRQTLAGSDSKQVYQANLAILEAAIKNLEEISVPSLDENVLGEDLNHDGQYTVINTLQRPDFYLGLANDVDVVTFLYPEGTEFLHTVRYVGVDEEGMIFNAPRMKEVRYMVKTRFYGKPMLGNFYAEEEFEKDQGMLPYYRDLGDAGIDNGFGWTLQGFIEDADGSLRPQDYEETLYCMGCHTTIGATIDKTFAFPRKVTGSEGWGYLNLHGMKDVPSLGTSTGEILDYLRRVGGGDEFRENTEMLARWFTADGEVDEAKVKAADVYELITPSRERALMLNKAYRIIVEEQSYLKGRDATVKPATNVYELVDLTSVPTLPEELHVEKDIRLDWSE